MDLTDKRKKEIRDDIKKHIQVDDSPGDTIEWAEQRYEGKKREYAVLVIGFHMGVHKQLDTCIRCVKGKDNIAAGPNM